MRNSLSSVHIRNLIMIGLLLGCVKEDTESASKPFPDDLIAEPHTTEEQTNARSSSLGEEGLHEISFSPLVAAPGDSVTVTGIHFPSELEVRFGPHPARVLERFGDLEIIIKVPREVEPGPIVVVTPSGQASSTDWFVPRVPSPTLPSSPSDIRSCFDSALDPCRCVPLYPEPPKTTDHAGDATIAELDIISIEMLEHGDTLSLIVEHRGGPSTTTYLPSYTYALEIVTDGSGETQPHGTPFAIRSVASFFTDPYSSHHTAYVEGPLRVAADSGSVTFTGTKAAWGAFDIEGLGNLAFRVVTHNDGVLYDIAPDSDYVAPSYEQLLSARSLYYPGRLIFMPISPAASGHLAAVHGLDERGSILLRSTAPDGREERLSWTVAEASGGKCTALILSDLLEDPSIRAASVDFRGELECTTAPPSSTIDSESQYAPQLVEAALPSGADAHSKATGHGTTVAVIDSGVNSSSELQGRLMAGFDAWSVVAFDIFYDPFTFPRPAVNRDVRGHGTAVAHVLAAARDGVGIVGIAPGTRILPVKVSSKSGSLTMATFVLGLSYIQSMSHEIDFANFSLGFKSGDGPSNGIWNQWYYDILEGPLTATSTGYGVSLVAAGGNGVRGPYRGGELKVPARNNAVIAVGATDISDNQFQFSLRGPELNLTAPGVDINIPDQPLTGHRCADGTSYAAPAVTGAAALLKEFGAHSLHTLPSGRLEAILTSATDQIPGTASEVGSGRLNVGKTLWAAEQGALSMTVHPDPALHGTGYGSVSLNADGSVLFTSQHSVVDRTSAYFAVYDIQGTSFDSIQQLWKEDAPIVKHMAWDQSRLNMYAVDRSTENLRVFDYGLVQAGLAPNDSGFVGSHPLGPSGAKLRYVLYHQDRDLVLIVRRNADATSDLLVVDPANGWTIVQTERLQGTNRGAPVVFRSGSSERVAALAGGRIQQWEFGSSTSQPLQSLGTTQVLCADCTSIAAAGGGPILVGVRPVGDQHEVLALDLRGGQGASLLTSWIGGEGALIAGNPQADLVYAWSITRDYIRVFSTNPDDIAAGRFAGWHIYLNRPTILLDEGMVSRDGNRLVIQDNMNWSVHGNGSGTEFVSPAIVRGL